MGIKNMISLQKIPKLTKKIKIGDKKEVGSIQGPKAHRKEGQLVQLIAHMRDKRERKKD